jgi:tetraacyldisaccharide 4'-kinase
MMEGMQKLLYPLTLPQRIGMARRLARTPHRVDARVVSFGNITAGGTGKTPAVIERVQQELAAGNRVAVLTRGYGSARTPEPLVVPPEERDPTLWRRIGDEPALVRLRAPGVWVVKSAERVAGAMAAVAAGCNCIVMDDGFQAVSLGRDEDIVLVDAARPFGNGCIVPLGTLREEPSALARATQVWLTRCDDARQAEETAALVERYHRRPPARRLVHAPVALIRVATGEAFPLEMLRGRRIVAASAIARPDAFEHALENLGATIQQRMRHRDHHAFAADSLPSEPWVLVTEKDAVRLDGTRENVYALQIALRDV